MTDEEKGSRINPPSPWPRVIDDLELKKELEKINWPIQYGSVKIQLRQGKPTLITIERTVKLD